MVEGHRCPQAWCGHAKMYLEKGGSKHILMMWCAICFRYGYAVLRKGMEDYQSLLVLHIGSEWTLSFRVGIPGVTIPKTGVGDNELILS